MKKFYIFAILVLFFVLNCFSSFAVSNFSQAVLNCDSYSQSGEASNEGDVFRIDISLSKKANKCVYKEKISNYAGYELLTCNFEKDQLKFISDSMKEYSEQFKKELAKNKIFEAKLTSNGVIFQKYLVNPNICKITHAKSK